jgi:hypothetical protein
MSYKVENGKVYEIKEVNASEIEKEIKQVIEFIKQHETAKQPYVNALEKKVEEFRVIKERHEKEIASYQAVVDEHDQKISEAKSQLLDKKEVIDQLFPNYKDTLGF